MTCCILLWVPNFIQGWATVIQLQWTDLATFINTGAVLSKQETYCLTTLFLFISLLFQNVCFPHEENWVCDLQHPKPELQYYLQRPELKAVTQGQRTKQTEGQWWKQRIKGGMINEEKRRKFKRNLVRALLIPMVTGCHLLTRYLCMTVLLCFNEVHKPRQTQRERNRRMDLKLWLARGRKRKDIRKSEFNKII